MLSSVKSFFKAPEDRGSEQQPTALSREQQVRQLDALRAIIERHPDFQVGDYVRVDQEAVNLGLATDYLGNTEKLPSCGYVLSLQTDWLSDISVKRPCDKDSSVVLLAIEHTSPNDFLPPVLFRKFNHRLFRKAPQDFLPTSRALLDFVYDTPVDRTVAPGTLVRARAGHQIDCGVLASKSLSSVKSGSTGFVRAPMIVLARPEAAEGEPIQNRLTLAYFADDACHVGRTVVVYPYEICSII